MGKVQDFKIFIFGKIEINFDESTLKNGERLFIITDYNDETYNIELANYGDAKTSGSFFPLRSLFGNDFQEVDELIKKYCPQHLI